MFVFFFCLLASLSGQRTQRKAPGTASPASADNHSMELVCVKGNLPITQGLYQSCVAQMWSQRPGVNPSPSLTRADHMHFSSVMTARMKNKTPGANPPTCGQLATGEGSGGRQKVGNDKNAFVLAVTLLRSLGNKEFTLAVWERIAVNVCTQTFCPHACTHARTHAHTQPDNFRSGGHGCVQLTEQMQIAVEDELVPDRDEKIIKSPKKEKKKRVLDVCLN